MAQWPFADSSSTECLAMIAKIAALICMVFILFLFWTDTKRKEPFSRGLWVPFLWMFFGSGRYLDDWLHLGAKSVASVKAYDQGNSVNAAAFLALIIAGLHVLSKRNIDWGRFLSKNKILWLYLSFCLLSVLWADLPFTSFKRWLKEFGNLVMVLVVLTDARPYEAIGAVLRRLGYLWLPLSVIFIKYYPALGRSYTDQGAQMYTGIGMQKNELGSMCLISLIYYAWYFLFRRKTDFKFWSINNLVDLVLLFMALWLLRLSQSSTSLGCAVIALSMLAAGRFSSAQPDRILAWSVLAVLLYLGLNQLFALNAIVIHMLGRKENLTGRTKIWLLLKAMAVDPWIGTGYQSFWVGDRLRLIWEKSGSEILQAHDGYLEQYLELGYMGVGFILALMLTGLAKIRRLCLRDYAAGVLMLCFLVIATLYNYTEASFYAISNIWLLMVLAVTRAPGRISEETVKHVAGYSKEIPSGLRRRTSSSFYRSGSSTAPPQNSGRKRHYADS